MKEKKNNQETQLGKEFQQMFLKNCWDRLHAQIWAGSWGCERIRLGVWYACVCIRENRNQRWTRLFVYHRREANIYEMSAQMLNYLDDLVLRLQDRVWVSPILCLQCQPSPWLTGDLSCKGYVRFKNITRWDFHLPLSFCCFTSKINQWWKERCGFKDGFTFD